MTQPDQLHPSTAANFTSLAEWAGKTQEDWEGEIHADTTAHFLDFEDGMLAILSQIPIIGDIIEILTGVEDGDLGDLGTWVSNLPVIGDIVEALTGVVGGDLGDLDNWVQGLVQLVDGFLDPSWFGQVPVGSISDVSPNLVTNPNFDTNLAGWTATGDWEWDSAQNHSGTTTSGSAKTSLGGTLRSNLVPTVEGHRLTASGALKWVGGTGVGGGTVVPFQLPVTLGSNIDSPILPVELPFTLGGGGGNPTEAGRLQLISYLGSLQVDSHTMATLSAPGGWTVHDYEYTVPSGVDFVALLLEVDEALNGAGSVYFDGAALTRAGLLPQNMISDLISDLANRVGLGEFQELIDTVWQAISGLPGVNNLLADLYDILQQIPFINVLGTGGPANIGEAIQTTWDQLVSGFVGVIGGGSSLADLFNVGQLVSSRATLGQFSWDILGIRNNKSLDRGFLSTSNSNFPLSRVALQPSAPTFAVTQSATSMGFERIGESMSLGVVSWLGEGSTNITDFRIVVWAMNTITGAITPVHTSQNQAGLLSSAMAWRQYVLADSTGTLTPLAVQPGEVYGFEFCVVGTGTHSIVGESTWLPNHTAVYPRRMGATRTGSTTTFPPAARTGPNVPYSANTPWVEYGINIEGVNIPHSPITEIFLTAGTASTVIPSWSTEFDIIALGGGGGGQGCGILWGEGGDGGTWVSETVIRGVDIPTATVVLSITVGNGGGGSNGFGANGQAGQSSVVSAAGAGSITAPGGAGGNAGNAATAGKSPGSHTYNGITYSGGAVENTYRSDGNSPGGGGAGSNLTTFDAGDGAPGAVIIVFRQV